MSTIQLTKAQAQAKFEDLFTALLLQINLLPVQPPNLGKLIFDCLETYRLFPIIEKVVNETNTTIDRSA
jgi:hypothetical protein